MSPLVHYAHGLVMMECLFDNKGAVMHFRTAKRLDAGIDIHYSISSAMQIAQQLGSSEAGKEDLDTLLGLAQKHQKLATSFNGRFWRILARSREDSIDVTMLLKVVRTASHHEGKAHAIFRELLKKSTRNVAVLRSYGKFLLATQNDQESAEAIFSEADELEERESKKHRKV